MSNIRSLGSIRNNQPQGIPSNAQSSLPFSIQVQNQGVPQDPRSEKFHEMIKQACCPELRVRSFMFIITVADIFIFLLLILIGGVKRGDGAQFLQPEGEALIDAGAKYAYPIRYKYHIHRWFFPLFLHAGFSHLLYNCISQLIFGTSIEARHGTKKVIIIYFLSGIGANIFSSLVSNEVAVGASTSIFGLLGSMLGYLALNWHALNYPGSGREKFLCVLIIFIFINFVTGLSNQRTDTWGHVGGLIFGILIGLAILDTPGGADQSMYVTRGKFIGKVTVALLTLLFIILFYSIREPSDIYNIYNTTNPNTNY